MQTKKYYQLTTTKDKTFDIFRVRPQYVTHVAPVNIQSTKQNFFSGSKDLLNKIPDHEKGPRVDSKGNIIKYSVVGSISQFLTEKQKNNTNVYRKGGQIRISANTPTAIQQTENNQTERFSIKDQSSKELYGKKMKNRIRDYQEIQLNEDQVNDQIQKIQDRLDNNKINNQIKIKKLEKKLSVEDFLKLNYQERVLNKFDQTSNDWESLQIKVETLIHRPPGSSLIDRIEQHRQKQEIKRILESLQPIEEKQGNDFWKLGLRKLDQTVRKSNFADYFEKNHQIYGNPKTPQIEIVRRHSMLNQSDFKPFSTFTSQSALSKKLSDNSDLIKKLIPTIQDDIGNLEIIGQNVLENEIVQIRSQSQKQQYPYVRFSEANDQNKQYIMKVPTKPETNQEEEIIEQNYTRKRQISQENMKVIQGYF